MSSCLARYFRISNEAEQWGQNDDECDSFLIVLPTSFCQMFFPSDAKSTDSNSNYLILCGAQYNRARKNLIHLPDEPAGVVANNVLRPG
jgi:hypothetical protein